MLKTLLVALVAANLLFFVFSLGWLDGIAGIDSLGGREPGRLALQFRPDSIRLLPMPMPAAASGPIDGTTRTLTTPSSAPSAPTSAR